MTNNLKAERTLTAEELQAIIDGCEKATPGPWFEGDKWVFVSPRSGEPTHALENIFRDVPEAQENCLHVSRLDPETVKAMASMAIQSLSTQQTMGEVTALDIADTCDGVEQYAFEAWAASEKYDMEEHPLHYIFMHPKTDAARMGWRAGIEHARKRLLLSALHPNQESGE